MATLKKLDPEKKRLARKIGKLPAAPKKPKRGASLSAMENYVSRYNDYVDKIHNKAAQASKLHTLQKQIFK